MKPTHTKSLATFRELGKGKYKTRDEEAHDKAAIIEGVSREPRETGVRTAYLRCDMATENNVALQRDRLVKRVKARGAEVQLGAAGAEELLMALAWWLDENETHNLMLTEGRRMK